MKNLSLARLALVALFILSSLKIFATEPDFQVNGIYYKIISIGDRECSVYGPVYPDNNPDKIIIPSEVKYNGSSFTVVGVFGDAHLRTKRSRYVNVKELVLPNSVKTIGQSAFYNVRSLERIQMDGVEYISSNAFESCKNLKTISTSLNRLKYIGDAAFFDCQNLEQIIIPPSCRTIEESAFSGCVNRHFTVIIQDSDEPLLCTSTLGYGKKIYIGRNIWSKEWYDSYLRENKHDIYQGDIYYFKEIEFGDKVTEMLVVNPTRRYEGDLDNFAFKLTIGAAIKVVPDFRNDNMTITSLYLVSQVPPLGGGFSNRTYLHGTLYVPKGSLEAYKNKGGWKNFLNIQEYETSRTIEANKEYLAKKKAEEAEAERRAVEAKRKAEEEARRKAEARAEAERYNREVEARIRAAYHPTIPEGTTEIEAEAYKLRPIKSITIPNSVTRIGDGAFEGCTALTSIIIPSSVKSIGNSAFSGCTGLTSITIEDGVTSIGNSAFSGCAGLKSITIPNSVTSIGNSAFSGCAGLTSPIYNAHVFAYMPTTYGEYGGTYTIADGIRQIAGQAFANCEKWKSIMMPNSVTYIGEGAFYRCFRMSFTLPCSVTYIGDNAFHGCSSLKSIEISNSVTSIGDKAFDGCRGLISIEIPNSVTNIGRYAFKGCENLKISLPKKWKDKVYLKDCKRVKFYN